MKFWVGVTDNNWYQFLANRDFEEVNFWQPSARPLFVNPEVGMPFLFKLKRPANHIAGGGYFVAHSVFPLSLAWEIFGEKNGARSLDELRETISPHVSDARRDPDIGCTVLSNPFFMDKFSWMHDPPGWSPNIVRGKHYDTEEGAGLEIWNRVIRYFVMPGSGSKVSDSATLSGGSEAKVKFGAPVLQKPRIGQSTFRVRVTDAYKRRCAMTGESTLVVLEAAHIVPYSKAEGSHDVSNGMLLRSDFHRLFDRGLVSVTPQYLVRVSPRIKEAYFNGKAYYRLDNQPLQALPDNASLRPDRDRLDWHFRNCFQA
ncbi:MAG: HNH endonuclease [Xanthomonadales bacterium]|nr:HNH endonuclease [Xanthomonadales bacterium]MCZ2095901.1 HNH endonuclease [Anaerolineae bacterium]MDL1867992.1 HNH endonuclease [Gammaproteobacteria bacterium PRO6]